MNYDQTNEHEINIFYKLINKINSFHNYSENKKKTLKKILGNYVGK